MFQSVKKSAALLFTMLLVFSSASAHANLIAFGDSITDGCSWPGDVYYYSCGTQGKSDTYPLYLQSLLKNNGWATEVINYGVGGESTSMGLNRLDSVLGDTCHTCIDYVLIMEGTNDLLMRTPVSVIRLNLSLMIDKVRAYGFQPLIATLTPDPEYQYKEIDLLNKDIRLLAVEKNVQLVDIHAAVAGNWNAYTHPLGCYEDQTHPNPSGFQAIATTWYNSLGNVPLITGKTTPYGFGALVNGTINLSQPGISEVAFQYGESCVMNKKVFINPSMLSGSGRVNIQAAISGLKSDTVYYYRLTAVQNGNVLNGGTKTFTTKDGTNLPWLFLLLNNE